MHRLAVLAVLVLLSACASGASVDNCAPGSAEAACAGDGTTVSALPPVPNGFQPWAEAFKAPLRFMVGDEIRITLPFYEDEDLTTTVAPDGNIYIGLLGEIRAVDRTPSELEAELKERYSRFLRFPEVGVVPVDFGNRQVFVGGEVREPGALELRGPTGVLEAVFEAGGFEETARRDNVVLIRRGPNDLPMLRYLDLQSFATDGTPTENTLLQPSDIVFVPKSGIARVNKFIAQYIEGVVPFNHNFNYILFDSNEQ